MPQQLPAIGADVTALMGGGPPPSQAPASRYPEGHPLAGYDESDVMGQPIMPIPAGAAGAITGAGSKALSWAKSAASQAAPQLKYEGIKTGLEALGVPPSLATTVAMIASSAKRPGRPSARPASSASPASPSGSTPAPPTSPTVPAARGSVATAPASWSPQRLRNEVGLAARRANAKFSDHDYEIAEGMVKQGVSPVDAVKTVAQQIAPPPGAATATVGKLKLTVPEVKEYSRLRGLGKSHVEATTSIQEQRKLATSLGLPTTTQVQKAVAERNATGRWPPDKK